MGHNLNSKKLLGWNPLFVAHACPEATKEPGNSPAPLHPAPGLFQEPPPPPHPSPLWGWGLPWGELCPLGRGLTAQTGSDTSSWGGMRKWNPVEPGGAGPSPGHHETARQRVASATETAASGPHPPQETGFVGPRSHAGQPGIGRQAAQLLCPALATDQDHSCCFLRPQFPHMSWEFYGFSLLSHVDRLVKHIGLELEF